MLDPIRSKARTIALVAAAFVGGIFVASGLELTAGSHAASLLQVGPSAREVQPVANLSEAFIAIADATTPAVVNISTERTQRAIRGHQGIPEPFRRFFDIPEGGPQGGGPEVPLPGTGTGFLITEDGYVMTNNHVVEDATRIRVTLQDRRQFDATVVGRDPTTDIAVIRIEGNGFPAARIGRSEDVRVGEWVLAIGNPLGLDFTVTAGIISARGRGLGIINQSVGPTAIEDFIQTDAAINPGNSGGPLVNLRGEVIGINSAIASRTGYSQGYGFAVPVDLARRVADDLIRYGRSRRPMLGVNITAVTPEDAEAYGLPSVAGAVVQDFADDSPARRAGIQEGDVIVAVDGRPIEQSNELQRVIATRRPGETVEIDVVRYGERRQLRVQLAEVPTADVAVATPPAATRERAGTEARLGVQVAALTGQSAQEYGFTDTDGVVITEVQPYSAAFRAGLRSGMRIRQVDRQPVRTVDQFQRIIRGKRPGEVISLAVEASTAQGGRTRSILNVRMPS
ncbi:Do family serine endopeptidase [soil metagenome]